MKTLALATFTVTLAATSIAQAGGSGWSCRTCGFSNGTELTGLALTDFGAAAPLVATVVLPPAEPVEPASIVLAKKKQPKPRPNYDDIVRDNTVTDSEYWQVR